MTRRFFRRQLRNRPAPLECDWVCWAIRVGLALVIVAGAVWVVLEGLG